MDYFGLVQVFVHSSIGIVFGLAVGAPLAFLGTLINRGRLGIEVFVILIRSLPIVAMPYLLLNNFRVRDGGDIIMAALVCTAIIYEYLIDALRRGHPELVWVVRSAGIKRRAELFFVRLPQAFPFLLRAVQQCFPVAILYVVLFEYAAGQNIGKYIVGLINSGAPILERAHVILSLAGVSALAYWIMDKLADRVERIFRTAASSASGNRALYDEPTSVSFSYYAGNLIGGIAAFLMLWQAAAWYASSQGSLNALGPIEIIMLVVERVTDGDWVQYTRFKESFHTTLSICLYSVAIGSFLGIVLAILCQNMGPISGGLNAAIGLSQSVPMLLYFPIVLIVVDILGAKADSYFAAIVIGCASVSFFGVFQSVRAVLSSMPTELQQIVDYAGGSAKQRWVRRITAVQLPYFLYSGMRIALVQVLPTSLVAALTTEMLFWNNGLGAMIRMIVYDGRDFWLVVAWIWILLAGLGGLSRAVAR